MHLYDDFGRILSAVYTEDGDATKVLESYAYTYDKNDNILTETRISNLPAEDSVINETRAYDYDAYGRLTKSTKTDHTDGDSKFVTTYEYDAVGNRVKMTEGGMVTTYDYNGLNQLEKADTTDAEIEYTYDERGNQVLESNTTTEETVETTYNVAGEMVQLVKKSGSTTLLTQTNVYNQDGIRISRTQGNSEREYYYNNGVVSYTEDNNSLSSANIQNDDGGVIGTYRGSTYYNYLKNMQGSTESIISETGTTAAVYTYSDFGETEEVVADTIGNEICYTGAIYDKDTGLYYMNARYYDAENGRFISQDGYRGEIDDAGTWHLYAYCSNNPINYVDPSGHASLGFWNSKQKYFAYNQNAPQKYFGYYDVYDRLAFLILLDITTHKVTTKKWKLQLWKGKYGKMYGYGVSSGCEIGLYYKDGAQWKCAYQKARRIRMQMSLYKKGYKQKMFSRDSNNTTKQKKAWWLTAFQPANYMPGKKAVGPSKLKMKGTLYFKSNDKKYRTEMEDLSKAFKKSSNSKLKVGGDKWKRTFTWSY